MERKKLFLYTAVLWTLFMAYLCLTDFSKLPKFGIGGIDKSVHFILHFFFTLFWYLYLDVKQTSNRFNGLFVVIASVLYGSFIEVAQALFTTTRKADVFDVAANSIGTAGACICIFMGNFFLGKRS